MAKFEQKPKIFLAGHSFGSAVILKMAVVKPEAYAGIIFFTPAIKDDT